MRPDAKEIKARIDIVEYLASLGSVVNVYGRSLSDNYRHMYLPARRDVIFNIDHVEGDSAILTESVVDALSLVAVGIGNAVSSLSVHLTRHQIEILAARFARLDIAFDGDEAGTKGARAAAAELRARDVEARIVSLPDDSDINSLVKDGATPRDLQSLLDRSR